MDPPDVYMLSPAMWNLHTDVYATNEGSMLDWEGNMQQPQDCERRIVLEDIGDLDGMVSFLYIGNIENDFVDNLLRCNDKASLHSSFTQVPIEADEVKANLSSIE